MQLYWFPASAKRDRKFSAMPFESQTWKKVGKIWEEKTFITKLVSSKLFPLWSELFCSFGWVPSSLWHIGYGSSFTATLFFHFLQCLSARAIKCLRRNKLHRVTLKGNKHWEWDWFSSGFLLNFEPIFWNVLMRSCMKAKVYGRYVSTN